MVLGLAGSFHIAVEVDDGRSLALAIDVDSLAANQFNYVLLYAHLTHLVVAPQGITAFQVSVLVAQAPHQVFHLPHVVHPFLELIQLLHYPCIQRLSLPPLSSFPPRLFLFQVILKHSIVLEVLWSRLVFFLYFCIRPVNHISDEAL